jgi:hypothetical protein
MAGTLPIKSEKGKRKRAGRYHHDKSAISENKPATFSHAISPQRAQQAATVSAIAAVNVMNVHRLSIKPQLIHAPIPAPATRPQAKLNHPDRRP